MRIAALPPRLNLPLALSLCSVLAFFTSGLAASPGENDRGSERKSPFSAIAVFGDSLSDTGRTFRAIGIPPPPYFNGRVSNGPIWVEYLAPSLRLAYDPLDNFAWAGANTGRTNVYGGLPGMLDELDEYLASLRHKADKKALYIVWGGANDFIRILSGGQDPNVVIPAAVSHLVSIVTRLEAAGAENIVVIDLPDMGLTPRARAAGPAVAAQATALSAMFNTLLDQALDQLDFPVVRVSSFALLNTIVAAPAAYGFTDVTSPGILNPANASTYLFWDDVHASTRMHALLAEAVFDAVAEAGLLKQLLKHP